LSVCVFAQNTAKRHGLKESEVQGFYVIEKDTNFQPENGGIDFTSENNFVIRDRNITAREIKTQNGAYYLLPILMIPKVGCMTRVFFPILS
jgi:hypothetical protein